MRLLVLIAEYFVFIPGLVIFMRAQFAKMNGHSRLIIFFYIFMLPCALFVDHGHYQFN